MRQNCRSLHFADDSRSESSAAVGTTRQRAGTTRQRAPITKQMVIWRFLLSLRQAQHALLANRNAVLAAAVGVDDGESLGVIGSGVAAHGVVIYAQAEAVVLHHFLQA